VELIMGQIMGHRMRMRMVSFLYKGIDSLEVN